MASASGVQHEKDETEGGFSVGESSKENFCEVVENDAQEIQQFIERQRSENTTLKTTYDMNVWQRFCESVEEGRKLQNIPTDELNTLLCKFFMTVTKKNGDVYEPSSLTSFQRSIQRQLTYSDSTTNIITDPEFNKSREVLLARKKQLVEVFAKGNRPQAARALTEAEEDLLFDQGHFGKHSPEVLQRTIWWALSLHFGFRARDESRKLRWGDIALDFDPETQNEILVWRAERGSKTRHGEGHQRAFYPTAQATGNRRCPVELYKVFASHRPESAHNPESPFFLAINHKRKPESQVWYTNGALGKNSIGKFLVDAAKAAGLPGNVTNHSVRKTCISRLMDAEVPENYVAQLSGHKNLKSLDAYKAASTAHQRKMSKVLSRSTSVGSQQSRALQPSASVNYRESASSTATGLFSGANIGKFEGCTFNFNFAGPCSSSTESSSRSKTKRRRLAIDDSDSE